MDAYKTREFARWARKQGLHDAALVRAVREMQAGLVDADLGGGLFKKRIARPGQGKRGGIRTLVATNKSDTWFFLYGFAKNERSDIDRNEEAALKKWATVLLAMSPATLGRALMAEEIVEVDCDE